MANLIGTSTFSAEEHFKTLGATHKRISFYETASTMFLNRSTAPLSCYFFNENDVEIGYFFYDTVNLLGITIHDKPRVWGDSFKLNYLMGEPTMFDCFVCSKYSKDEIRRLQLVEQ